MNSFDEECSERSSNFSTWEEKAELSSTGCANNLSGINNINSYNARSYETPRAGGQRNPLDLRRPVVRKRSDDESGGGGGPIAVSRKNSLRLRNNELAGKKLVRKNSGRRKCDSEDDALSVRKLIFSYISSTFLPILIVYTNFLDFLYDPSTCQYSKGFRDIIKL